MPNADALTCLRMLTHCRVAQNTQAKQVRQQAGANLGQLAALSARVDQLAGDQLASSLHAAEPHLKEVWF